MLLLLYLTVGIATLVAILSVLRTRLVFELQATSLLLFGTDRPGIFLYTAIMLPGTVVHELSHWLVAELLRVRTGKITILPESMGTDNKKKLGSVATETTDPFRGFAIGIAPFVSGLAILILLSWLVVTGWGERPWWHLALAIYGIMVTGNSMLTSEADRRNWPIAIGVAASLAGIAWYLGLRPPASLIASLVAVMIIITQVLGLTAAINLATIGACSLARFGIEKISHKQVIRH